MIICHGIIIFITSIFNLFYINLNMLDINVFSPAGNNHQVNIYLSIIIIIIDLKTKNKKK